jgi:hypothetical protein
MTHQERQAYAQRLMAVLQGDAPAALLTESGEMEVPPVDDLEISDDLRPILNFTSADRRDQAAIRALRVQVLQDAPTCGFPPMQNDPLGCLMVLCSPEYIETLRDTDWKAIPEQVRQWCYTFQRIQLRAMGRWLHRGRGPADGIVINLCHIWTLLVLFGREDRWPRRW